MPYKSILCITGAHEENIALEGAILLCQNTNAHLSVLAIGVSPAPAVYSYGMGVAGGDWATEMAVGKALMEQRSEAIKRQLQRAGISADVNISYCDSILVNDVIGERARYADVTLISADMTNEDDLRNKTIYGALYYSARPVLLSPPSRTLSYETGKVMIAWDSGLPATRAVGLAMEHMKLADEVYIVMVDPISTEAVNGNEPGIDLAQYLVRHGLKIEVERLAGGGRPVAKVLQQHAIDIDAGLIVMGAYGRSRLHNLIFGGTTSAMLKNVTVPVLMAH